MKKRFFILLLCTSFMALPATAQRGFGGSWQWMSRANKNKEQVYFSVDIKQAGNKVSGRYWFNLVTDGESSDASFVPFIGTIKGQTISIEFNPSDIHGIDEENVRYKKPKSPSTATLTFKNGKLEWKLTKGKLDAGDLNVPQQLTLSRVR
ncbi:MAG TPA: hypothetical protein VM934_18480 [Pyrinomonadaceae bacterium]|jgi:hypothetical protein|nr:hypothetical protein [Pyrinomonadaceae bacterium]